MSFEVDIELRIACENLRVALAQLKSNRVQIANHEQKWRELARTSSRKTQMLKEQNERRRAH